MANRLAGETSPYLLEHADNPVDWYPWGPEALERARREDRPILLSIGYSACHWCHVMARESFEDPEIAALMNRHFVCIKVDREERPDLDQVYMRAVQAMTGAGGWPMTMFLLPDGTPFFGGTYFPPDERHGLPSFRRVLIAVAEAYALRRGEVRSSASRVGAFLRQPGLPQVEEGIRPELLENAFEEIARGYDPEHGGFGGAPKFPQPMVLDFLLRTHRRTGAALALEMVSATLTAMASGGIHDQLGGGFHRYAVDARWLVPHFEKMLYDNGLLPRIYLEAWQVTGNPAFRQVAEDGLDFVLRELALPEGGFASSLDADSEGEEGRFYLWTPAQLSEALGPKDATEVARAFDVTEDGNFEGRNILHAVAPEAREVMRKVRTRFLAVRNQRVRPHRDDKALAGWNGLLLRALAEAARVLEREDYLDSAIACARFMLSRMRTGDRMRRSFKDGRALSTGFLEDQAAVADGLLALHEATFDPQWLDSTRALISEMLNAFWDEPSGSFFDTASDHEALVTRPREVTDNAVPSGTSIAVDVLLRAGALLGEEAWVEKAVRVLERLAPVAAKAPLAFGRLLCALDFHLGRPVELAFVGAREDPGTRALIAVTRPRYLPNRLLAQAEGSDGSGIPLLKDRRPAGGRPTAYLCEGFVCRSPTTDPAELARQLDRAGTVAASAGPPSPPSA